MKLYSNFTKNSKMDTERRIALGSLSCDVSPAAAGNFGTGGGV
jgi:hypothetical protein